uniref:pentapeptide repeat-containing protein n=1 Tax=Campylobacter coli TaxID=195 RepID=UPI00092FBA38
VVDFSKTKFNSKIDFLASVFKGEVRFIETQFQAEQSNNEIIENIFEEVVFEERASFDNAIFNARVSFRISQFENEASFIRTRFRTRVNFENSQFKDEVRFIETQFQAEQSNNETIENDFREVIFERRVSFSSTTFQARVSFTSSHFKDEVNFAKTEFQANQNDSNIIENQFLGVIFAGKVIFDDAKFQARVDFGISQFKDEVRFIETQFQAEQSSNRKIIENEFREAIFKGKVTFDSLVLKARISFSFSTFKDEALFLNINPNNFIFYNVEFNKTKFACKTLTNVIFCLFQYSVFKDALSFKGMKIERLRFDNVLFNGVVTFSNTKFNAKPQFINCTFSNQFNIEHQYIKYSDKDIENKINNIQDKNDKFRALLNLRDLFRKLKSNRIAHHNLIDASELRTQELYARELELKYQENKSLREKIERWQLVFYRKLCDHHTDLLKAFHNLLIVVMLFGMFSFALDKFKQPSHIENDIKYNIVKVDSNENYIFKEHNKTTYNLLSLNIEQESDKFIKNDFVYMIVFLILVLLLLSFNIFTSIYIFGSILYLIFSFLDLLALYTHIAVIVFFVLFALKFILLDDRQRYKRGIVVAISYTVCIFTLLVKPSLLLPALGSFLDKDSNATYPLLLSLSVVYFILVVLILFSLQKTARKNSIVPS